MKLLGKILFSENNMSILMKEISEDIKMQKFYQLKLNIFIEIMLLNSLFILIK